MPFYQIDFISTTAQEITIPFCTTITHSHHEKVSTTFFAGGDLLAKRVAKTVDELMLERGVKTKWNIVIFRLERKGYQDVEINLKEINYKDANCASISIEKFRDNIVQHILKLIY